MKVSIVIPVLNSHKVVRRHIRYWRAMDLPKDVEIILVDDGSNPPIYISGWGPLNITVYRTHDTRPWTWALARNVGARLAQGEYLLMTDIDYIIPRGVIDDVRTFSGDKMRFRREFGVLDENGEFTQDLNTLRQYGLLESRIQTKGVSLPPHPNNFAMRRELFWELGGFREDLVEKEYPQREDGHFKRKWVEWLEAGKVQDHDYRPTIYMFPNGQFCGDVDYNPFNLFHTTTRKTSNNPWYKKQLAKGA